jgi:hypothetical protein
MLSSLSTMLASKALAMVICAAFPFVIGWWYGRNHPPSLEWYTRHIEVFYG